MATYTMQLRTIVEMYTQLQQGLTTNEKIEVARPQIFDFSYPLFNESYRKDFETKILKHFYFREIGAETEEQFLFRMEEWLNLNMPYYNELFESALIEYDPLLNYDMTENLTRIVDKEENENVQAQNTSEMTNQTDSTQSTNGTSFNRDVEATTPEQRLHITTNEGTGVIEYADKLNENHGKATDSATGSETGTGTGRNESTGATVRDGKEVEEHTITRKGNLGVISAQDLVKKYRETLLRIEPQIFKEMNDLFMLIY